MTDYQPTTPFGRRPLSLAVIAAQTSTRAFAANENASETVVHKWRLFRAITETKSQLGVSDRALSVLHALLSFHQETALTLADPKATGEEEASGGIVVFPSNSELSIRAHGMPASTLRRHLAALVEAGLILRRDSPNGKRFARRGKGGAIAEAFGFDLAPLIARAAEIENLAEEIRAEKRAIALLREKITLIRRDVAKMIDVGIEERAQGDWRALQARFCELAGRYGRGLSRRDLEALAQDLAGLASEIEKLLEDHVKKQNMGGNERRSERHIQNQITNPSNLEPVLQEGGADRSGFNDKEPETERAGEAKKPSRAYPLGMVLQACPDIHDYGKSGEISNWRDLIDAAAIVRSALGVSPDAWRQAVDVLGEHDASIVIAAILQKGDDIKSAGGYLRALTAKARAGEFSLGPVMMALLRGKAARARKAAG
ncbi:MAG: plasmid replication protein RepC [Methylocystis sp.]